MTHSPVTSEILGVLLGVFSMYACVYGHHNVPAHGSLMDIYLVTVISQSNDVDLLGCFIRGSESPVCQLPVQALGKLRTLYCYGNILKLPCLLECFPVCPPLETLWRKQNLLPRKQKCSTTNSETFFNYIFVAETLFSSLLICFHNKKYCPFS